MRILKISQKKQKKKNYEPKKKQDHDDSSKKVEEKGEKTLVFIVKFPKRLITLQKNIRTMASPM